MSARLAVSVVFLWLAAFASGEALAQDGEANASEGSANEGSATSGEDAEARSLFTAGNLAFREGRYENALEYLQRAYALSHRPALLYNIGTTLDRLRRDEEALRAFEQYLREVPDADNHLEVESRAAVLRAAVEAERERSPHDAPTEIPTPAPTSATDVGAWILIGAGAASMVAGSVLLGLAVADVAAVENPAPGTAWSAVDDAYARSEGESIAGAVLLGVGAAATIMGSVWAVVPGQTNEASARLELVPAAGGLLGRGTF